jgi:glycerol-3-phosphate acyltransferase PlsY
MFWPAALIYALVWIGLLLILRISSVAGMAAAVSAPVTAAIAGERALIPILAGFAILVIWKHRDNLVRLRAGTEPRIGQSTQVPGA